jgi:hypothetical protein
MRVAIGVAYDAGFKAGQRREFARNYLKLDDVVVRNYYGMQQNSRDR